jgi:endonuclease/exonuclease/phosphatase family metal-dependent hydrolase
LAGCLLIGLLPTVGCADAAGPGDEDTTTPEPAALELTVMTYNVLCSFCDPTYDPWDDRLGYHQDIFERHAPDLIGLQELTFAEEVAQYLDLNPAYEAVYFATDDLDALMPAYPDQTILYRKDRFREIERGFFWLSPTPDEPFTVGFAEGASQFWRLVGWVLLEQSADRRRFYLVNTHFDNNPPSQELSGPLVYERLADLVAAHPVIFTGDFNTGPGDAAFDTLVEGADGHDWHFIDTWDIAENQLAITDDASAPADDRYHHIDHIFVAGGEFECTEWRVDLTTYGARDLFPSDHYAISARIVVR